MSQAFKKFLSFIVIHKIFLLPEDLLQIIFHAAVLTQSPKLLNLVHPEPSDHLKNVEAVSETYIDEDLAM